RSSSMIVAPLPLMFSLLVLECARDTCAVQGARACSRCCSAPALPYDRADRLLQVLFVVEEAHRDAYGVVLDVHYDAMPFAQRIHDMLGIRHQHVDDVRALLPRLGRHGPEPGFLQELETVRGKLAHTRFDRREADRSDEPRAVAQYPHSEEIRIAAL